MSHYPVLVLHRPGQSVDELLAPFASDLEVPEHEEICECLQEAAWHLARLEAETRAEPPSARLVQEFREAHGDEIDRLLASRFPDIERGRQLNEKWIEMNAAWRRAYQAALGPAMERAQPDPDCPECEGTGRVRTTDNPRARWDWYVVGGRFTGALDGYDPTADPQNWETCRLCQGTGRRTDVIVAGGCNRCRGLGRALKEQWKPHPGDTLPVLSLPRDYTPHAVVTPRGEWFEIAEPGYLGMVWEGEWMARVRDLLQRHSDCVATIVDVHM